jgi:hypothetical protein
MTNTIICIINITIDIIINIIIITLEPGVAARPKTIGFVGVVRPKFKILGSGLAINLDPRLLGCCS